VPNLLVLDIASSMSLKFSFLMHVYPPHLELLISKPYSDRSPKSKPSFYASSCIRSTSKEALVISIF